MVMRIYERIDNFLENFNLDLFCKKYRLNDEFKTLIKDRLSEIEVYWKKYYDQRFGQVLINLGILPDLIDLWYIEDEMLLQNLGVPYEKIQFWTSIFDEKNQRLENPIRKPLYKLDTSHIENILIYFLKCKSTLNEETFNYFMTRVTKSFKFKYKWLCLKRNFISWSLKK